jgi:hypothetical protein
MRIRNLLAVKKKQFIIRCLALEKNEPREKHV